jgi:hypothetical protein
MMERNKYFKTEDKGNYMSSYSNKSEHGNDYGILSNEDYMYTFQKTNMQSQKLDKSLMTNKQPEPENYEMSVPVR